MAVIRLTIEDVIGEKPENALCHVLERKGFPVTEDFFGHLKPDWTRITSLTTEYDHKTMEYIYSWEER